MTLDLGAAVPHPAYPSRYGLWIGNLDTYMRNLRMRKDHKSICESPCHPWSSSRSIRRAQRPTENREEPRKRGLKRSE
jgi:hypothetical protein